VPRPSEPLQISPRLFIAIKCAPHPAYRLGRQVGLEPSRLSAIMRDRVRPADAPRVRELAALVGVPADKVFRRRVDRRVTS